MSNDDAALGAAVRRFVMDQLPGVVLPEIKSPVSSVRGFVARLNQLERWFGGPAGAAAAVGVSLRTYRGWRRGGTPAKASRSKVLGAYDREHYRRSNTPARKRLQIRRIADAGTDAGFGGVDTLVWAEFQVDGYYNGQGKNGPARQPYPPDPGNDKAYRRVRFGQIDWAPIFQALTGSDAEVGAVLEAAAVRVMQGVVSPNVFLNSYFRSPSVKQEVPQ